MWHFRKGNQVWKWDHWLFSADFSGSVERFTPGGSKHFQFQDQLSLKCNWRDKHHHLPKPSDVLHQIPPQCSMHCPDLTNKHFISRWPFNLQKNYQDEHKSITLLSYMRSTPDQWFGFFFPNGEKEIFIFTSMLTLPGGAVAAHSIEAPLDWHSSANASFHIITCKNHPATSPRADVAEGFVCKGKDPKPGTFSDL